MELTCPECGATIPAENVSLEGEQAICPSCDRVLPLDQLIPWVALDEPLTHPAGGRGLRPTESKIVVERPGPGQATFFIPSRRNGAMLLFAAAWNGFMLIFTVAVVASGGSLGGQFFLAAFLAAFWAVGIGFLVAALFSVFGKTLVHVGSGQLAMKRELFGLGRLHRYYLEPGATAGLAVAYEQNDKPVYACSVSTSTKTVKFGSFLTKDEKAWLVEVINDTLGVSPRDSGAEPRGGTACPLCGRTLAGALFSSTLGLAKCPDCNQVYLLRELAGPERSTEPASAPADSRVVVEEDGRELRVVLPPMMTTSMGKTILAVSGVFGVVTFGAITATSIGAARVAPAFLLVLIPFYVVGGLTIGAILLHCTSPLELVFTEGVLEKTQRLLAYQRQRTLPLPSKARVEFAVTEPDQPAGVRVSPPAWLPLSLRYEGGVLHFGYHLSTQEKRWICQRINRFLEGQETPEE